MIKGIIVIDAILSNAFPFDKEWVFCSVDDDADYAAASCCDQICFGDICVRHLSMQIAEEK